ncbi:Sua5-YciO-YrdC-YwlC family protein [Salinisphaera shabanensis E1L3A]|uniref:Sua5-YciO-YrdC-YwlC family protein n=1 Tax=Salinisphaera shabanensis E1L3A TaxID=1033802 RepID=U2FRH9_9GAMM|nr:L-threonylcarbamoyladenylate synthase [Salinisphaera shabanensis]ERJ18689.1 Sua5-YciO-YrdC-YwlC family protein [Salinisphaera shabanensis E1L3A]
MADIVHVHAETPQPRRIGQVADALRAGRVIAYPTDSSYGLACAMGDKNAIDRIRQMRGFGRDHFFTLVCRDLSEISTYAKVENTSFRLLKAATPGAYTFVLPASKVVPNWLAHPKRKTIGIRVPAHPVARAIAEAMDEPIMSVTAQLPDAEIPLSEAFDVREAFDKQLDIIVDGGATGVEPTTVVDLTTAVPQILRPGKGSAEALGLDPVDA